MSVAVATPPPQSAAPFNALLLGVARDRDKNAFAELFRHFAPRIKSMMMRLGMPPDQADELAQDTMVSVWQKAGQYDPDQAAAATWIYTIARNRRIDMLRRGGKTITVDPGEAMENLLGSAEDNTGRSLDARKAAGLISNLPPEQADLIRKSYFEGLTHDEIARRGNIPLGTVKSRIRLALDKLRGSIAPEQDRP